MKAVIFSSKTGTTEKCAYMLAEKLGVTAYSLKAVSNVNPEDEVIYLGWVAAGSIQGLKKAGKIYNVKAVCAVGMNEVTDANIEALKNQNKINCKFYYLQGGLHLDKLTGISKLLMNAISKAQKKKLESIEKRTEHEENMLRIINNGGDFITDEKIRPIAEELK